MRDAYQIDAPLQTFLWNVKISCHPFLPISRSYRSVSWEKKIIKLYAFHRNAWW